MQFAVLGLSGYALFTARGTSTLHVPAEDVALVNQQPISRMDYLAQLQALFGVDLQHATAEQRKKVLDDMIREELFVQRGKELDVAASDPEVRAALVSAVELEIAADALTSAPTEAKLRSYFEAHRSKYSSEGIMTVHDYVFPSTASGAASEAVQELKGRAGPEALLRLQERESTARPATSSSISPVRIHLGDRLFEIAQGLADGQAAGPIEAPDGLHVLYMASNKKPRPHDFAAARDQVLNDYRSEAIATLRIGDESFLRKRANILIADDMRG